MTRLSRIFLLITSFWLATSCVGPATPFGAVDSLLPSDESVDPLTDLGDGITISFSPKRMLLHDKSDFKVEIYDPRGINPDHKIRLFYEGMDVSDKYLKNSEFYLSDAQRRLTVVFKDLRIPAHIRKRMRFSYVKSGDLIYTTDYKLPICQINQKRKIASIQRFPTSDKLIHHIEKSAIKGGYNPPLIAGIVAQESGFNPKAISWAKALGLTQITSIAEQEILSTVQEWPRHPGISDMSYLEVRSKILIGDINKENECRLDPKKSVDGGIAYLNYLENYWSIPDNQKIVESLDGDFASNLSQVILASYNSGAARTKASIIRRGKNWRESTKLASAHKYINKVSSYCYHFSSQEEM